MLITVSGELLLAVATVDVACRYCTLAIGGGNGVYSTEILLYTLIGVHPISTSDSKRAVVIVR
jgi:hypothetical protein